MMLTTHLYLLTRLRMCGANPLLPLYDFMACAGTTLSLPFSSVNTGLGDGGTRFDYGQDQLSYPTSQRPGRFYSPPSHLAKGYGG